MGGRVGSLLGIISTSLLLGPETSRDPCWSFKKVSILVWWLRSGPWGTWSMCFLAYLAFDCTQEVMGMFVVRLGFLQMYISTCRLYTDYHQFWYWSLWLVDECFQLFYPTFWDFSRQNFKCWDDGPVGRFDNLNLLTLEDSLLNQIKVCFERTWGGFSWSSVFAIHCWWFSAYTMCSKGNLSFMS